ncbi:MAG TPA: hypothetical protein VGH20_04980 [Myxococcales bacterium]|jgi:hypothetical protein
MPANAPLGLGRSATKRGALLRDGPLALLLLVAYGWLFVFSLPINNPNELVRIHAGRALLEQHRWSFAERRFVHGRFADAGNDWGYVNDKALVCDDPAQKPPSCAGRLYAAKAPAASVLAVPVLGVLKLFGPLTKTRAVFALRWVFCILPTVVFWLFLRRYLVRVDVPEETALAVTLCGALGSLSLTYGQMFAGHQLAALALGAAFLCGFWGAAGFGRELAVGFFAALAVALEYPSAPAAAILVAGVVLHRRRGLTGMARGLTGMALGAVPWALVLVQFHWSAFGKPWSTPYSHLENPAFVRDIAPGFLGISLPTLERVYGSLFSPYLGLFFWAPWMLLLFAAPWTLLGAQTRTAHAGAPDGHSSRYPALTAVVICGYYLVFQITHALWRSGWSVGPRYITPIVPFAAIAIALGAAGRGGRSFAKPFDVWLRGAGAAAIVATGLASSVCQGFPLEVENGLREVVWPLLSHGFAARNPLQLLGVPGLWSALPYFAALAVAVAVLLRKSLPAVALFIVLVAVQWLAPRSAERSAVHFLESAWEPNPPPGARPF